MSKKLGELTAREMQEICNARADCDARCQFYTSDIQEHNDTFCKLQLAPTYWNLELEVD